MHMLGEKIFGNEGTELYQAVVDAMDANTHRPHCAVVMGKETALIYSFIDKKQMEELDYIKQEEEHKRDILMMLIGSGQLAEIIIKNHDPFNAAYRALLENLNHEYKNLLLKKVSDMGICEKEGNEIKINIKLNETSPELLADILLFNTIINKEKKNDE